MGCLDTIIAGGGGGIKGRGAGRIRKEPAKAPPQPPYGISAVSGNSKWLKNSCKCPAYAMYVSKCAASSV